MSEICLEPKKKKHTAENNFEVVDNGSTLTVSLYKKGLDWSVTVMSKDLKNEPTRTFIAYSANSIEEALSSKETMKTIITKYECRFIAGATEEEQKLSFMMSDFANMAFEAGKSYAAMQGGKKGGKAKSAALAGFYENVKDVYYGTKEELKKTTGKNKISDYAIAKRFNELEIPTFEKDAKWHPVSVKRLEEYLEEQQTKQQQKKVSRTKKVQLTPA